jgi:hypothetical protein
MSLLWDLYQQYQISELNNRVADVGAAISTGDHRSVPFRISKRASAG